MNIAVVVPRLWYSDNTSKFSANLRPYIQAISQLGHQPLLICLEGSEYCVDFPVKTVPESDLAQPRFWRSLRLDAALVFTWLRHIPLLKAMKEAGVFIVSKGDTEGRISARVFPAYHFQQLLSAAHSPWEKTCAIRHWLRRRLYLEARPDREVIESISLAEKTALDTHTAKERLERHLKFYGQSALIQKLCVLPPPLADDFLTAPVLSKKKRITAIGRWNDPVKDAPLLAHSLSFFLDQQPDTEVMLLGGGSEKAFAPLCQRHPHVITTSALPRDQIILALSDTRILMMTSRGESFHFASHEALCLGASVVGPKSVIPIPDICREGPFGTEAQGRRPRQLAAALTEEMTAWESGQRCPQTIAAFWRPRLSGVGTIQQIVAMMPPRST